MFYQPELIVYLWLLPATLMIVIPAVLSACRYVIGILKNKGEEKEYITEHRALAHA